MDFVHKLAGTVELEDGSICDVGPFAIRKRATTVAEFREFCDATGYRTIAHSDPGGETYESNTLIDVLPHKEREQSSAFCISPVDANAYCEWKGERSPTESEWVYASLIDETIYSETDAIPWHLPNVSFPNHALFVSFSGQSEIIIRNTHRR